MSLALAAVPVVLVVLLSEPMLTASVAASLMVATAATRSALER